ncbi:MAG: N-acetylmuramoyl-L-alanine amidase [Oscillospiraceae bacterium]
MTILQMPCNPGNYTAKRTGAIRYLVVHYTGAPGTARNNGAYFASRGDIGASAHYFVDAQDIVQSVPDGGRAWHCGAASYRHPECRNDNSIGVELCCDQDASGRWRFDPATVANAVQLIRTLMAKYGIDADHVVRHYDVTGKVCPEPYVRDASAWAEFKARLTAPETEEEYMTRYNTVAEMPEYYRAEAQRLLESGALRGRGDGQLDVSEDMLRTLIIVQRLLEQASE